MPRNPKNVRARKRKPPPPQGLAAFLPPVVSFFDDPESPVLRWGKRLIGLLLLPVCWLMLETLVVLLEVDTLAGAYWKTSGFLYFGSSCLLWLVLFLGARHYPPMMWLYVAGHELTHALFVLLFRGRVTEVHISAQGGHIMTNRNNFVISLSPYFFPFYTAVVILAWAAMEWIVVDLSQPDTVWLYGLIGFTWMFHFTFTLWMIRREQPDVNQNGRLFSFPVIFIGNVLLICAMLIVSSPTATFQGFARSLWENGRTLYPRLAESIKEMHASVSSYGDLPITRE